MGKKSKGKGKDKLKKKERRKALQRDGTVATPARMDPGPAVPGPTPAPTDGGETIRVAAVDAMELAARLASISTVLQRHLSRADAGEGLTRARLSALTLLVLGGPRTLGDLAAAEHVRPPTMTRLVHALEADGLVARTPNPDDARSVLIRATAAGSAQLEQGRARQIAPLAQAISDLDRTERQRLEDAADLLGRVLRDPSWEPADPNA